MYTYDIENWKLKIRNQTWNWRNQNEIYLMIPSELHHTNYYPIFLQLLERLFPTLPKLEKDTKLYQYILSELMFMVLKWSI